MAMENPRHLVFSAVIFFLYAAAANCEESTLMSRYKLLKDAVLKDYDKLVRPINDTGNMTHVRFLILPRFIVDVNEEQSLFQLDSYFVMHWLDKRLSWNKDEHNVKVLRLPDNMVWRPDINLWNSHSSVVDPYQKGYVQVSDSGEVYWVAPATTTTFCNVAGKDEATCIVQVGSWSHNGWEIDLNTFEDHIDMGDFENVNPSWDVMVHQTSITRKSYLYECCPEPYHSIVAYFPLVRRPAPQVRMVRTPCIIVAILVLALLWLPPQECLARVLLGSVLFLVVNMLMVYVSSTAKSPHAGKEAEALVRSTTFLLSIILVMQVITMRLSRCKGPSRPSRTLMISLSRPIVQRVCLWNWNSAGDKILLKEEEEEEPTINEEWNLVAAVIDRTLFIICVPTIVLLLIVD